MGQHNTKYNVNCEANKLKTSLLPSNVKLFPGNELNGERESLSEQTTMEPFTFINVRFLVSQKPDESRRNWMEWRY